MKSSTGRLAKLLKRYQPVARRAVDVVNSLERTTLPEFRLTPG
jgi:hypothetical protein